ncbi:endonuclease/exonuclease/phosphatase family protein [Luteirhabdus pelagi]|uniref:endonuclease/exonuclease/phosphatase family protein n=1 Tax=Luteirhabdus pelagi TaxID=2792783 RepID=UPI001F15A064|nr:endonuclease/exonuclease/phosphatase family protein [Luteirhabdus pelagi]
MAEKSKRGCFQTLLGWMNSFVAFLLLLSFILPHLPPSKFPTLSLLGLFVSPLIFINLVFALYWLVQLKKKFWMSGIVLLLTYLYFNPFFEMSSPGDASEYQNTLTVLSHNVRLFNAYEDFPDSKSVSGAFRKMVEEQQPDVICIQEFYDKNEIDFSDYPYREIHFNKNNKLGHAIFSKYPLLNAGAFDFQNTSNNTLYADVVKGKDTIRIYNLHLQSLQIMPRMSYLQESSKQKLRKRLTTAFVKQEEQVKAILQHKKEVAHKTILVGDFNNTPFSYVYEALNEGMTDTFLEKGKGIGTTFHFDFYPMRIDYIFVSEGFEVIDFESLDYSFSDHFPVRATLGWPVEE